jgi:SAM-dependent methyltransferase
MLTVESVQAKALELKGWSGGPLDRFGALGSHVFQSLKTMGLVPEHTLVDIGCGCLRNGLWLIPYLDAGNYFGVEPNQTMLQEGIDTFIPPEQMRDKKPTFSNNDQFAFPFERRFDFALARSIFTHTSRGQMTDCLRNLAGVMNPGGRFALSYVPPKLFQGEYKGTEWLGRSHESKDGGMAYYRKRTILGIAKQFGFSEDASTDRLENSHQIWLVLRRQ